MRFLPMNKVPYAACLALFLLLGCSQSEPEKTTATSESPGETPTAEVVATKARTAQPTPEERGFSQLSGALYSKSLNEAQSSSSDRFEMVTDCGVDRLVTHREGVRTGGFDERHTDPVPALGRSHEQATDPGGLDVGGVRPRLAEGHRADDLVVDLRDERLLTIPETEHGRHVTEGLAAVVVGPFGHEPLREHALSPWPLLERADHDVLVHGQKVWVDSGASQGPNDPESGAARRIHRRSAMGPGAGRP